MGSIFKIYNVSLVDADLHVIHDYGDIAQPIIERIKQMPYNTVYHDDATKFKNYWASYLTDIVNLGNCKNFTAEHYGFYLAVAPLAFNFSNTFTLNDNYRIRLLSKNSGFYALSERNYRTLGSFYWSLYDNNNKQLVKFTDEEYFPLYANDDYLNVLTTEKLENNKIVGGLQALHIIRDINSNKDIYKSYGDRSTNKDVNIINWFNNIDTKTFLPTDPYGTGGTSSSGGGGGTFGGGNTIFGGNYDSIDVPPLPTASASSAGFITLFNPSLAQLNNLANYMWSDLFSLDTFKKIFADPMDCILGLSIVPVKPASAGTSAVKIGNVSTDVSMNKTSSQYVAVDCGTIDVKEYWGAYLDYAPYTQCEIYLPYVGTKQISVDDVMNKAVHVVYHVDILSGACNAYVKCGDSVLYTFVGQCSSSIPISGNDWTNVLNGAISVAGKIGLAMATGGATALMSGLGAASSIISSSKPTVERSGAMSSTGGLLGIQKPYLILTRPKQALPENQNKYTGYPSFITMALSECTGYTEIDSVHLENMTCTDEEAQEIENLLKSGVIF